MASTFATNRSLSPEGEVSITRHPEQAAAPSMSSSTSESGEASGRSWPSSTTPPATWGPAPEVPPKTQYAPGGTGQAGGSGGNNSEDLTWDRAFHSFEGSDGIHIHSNLVHAWGVRLDDPGGTAENNLEGDFSGRFVDPAVGDLHLTPTGAEAVLAQGLTRPSGAVDYDAEPRPDPPAIGADECAL